VAKEICQIHIFQISYESEIAKRNNLQKRKKIKKRRGEI
jgi:hypothetical protein